MPISWNRRRPALTAAAALVGSRPMVGSGVYTAQLAAQLNPYQRSRELELEADREAATMLARAGYPARICQHELELMARSIGDGSITEPESTHPGYEERLAAMRAHYDAMEQQSPAAEPSTRISTSYSRADNLLTLTPQPR